MFEGLFSTPTKQQKPQAGMFEGLFNGENKPSQTSAPVQKEKTVQFKDFLGGGEYKTAGPGTLISTPRGYGGVSTQKDAERDHIFPVALGGTSSKNNIQILPNDKRGQQAGKVKVEHEAIESYKSGKISLPEARLKVLTASQQIKQPLDTDPLSLKNLKEGVKELVKNPIKSLKNVIQTGEYKEAVQGVKEGAKTSASVIQAVPRAAVSTVLSPTKKESFTPKSKISKAILGEEPIKNLLNKTTDTESSIEKFAKKHGANNLQAKASGLLGAPLLVAGSLVSDLLPVVGAEKKAVKQLASETSEIIGKKEGLQVTKYLEELIANKNITKNSGLKTLKQKGADLIKDIKSKIVDSNAPIEDILRKSAKENKFTILPTSDITNQIDRVYRTPSIAGQFVRDNGLEDVIKKVDDLEAFDQYLIAKHGKDLSFKGITTGRNLEKDTMLVDSLASKYEPAAKVVRDYSQKILDYSVDSGLISRELADSLKKEYPNYVPIKRVFTEIESPAYGSKAVASLGKQSVVQRIKGSEREIESPIESILSKTNDAFVQGEKNKAAQMLTSYEKLPNNPFGLRKAEKVTDIQPGEETINVFRNGIKETWVANKDVVRAAKALDVQQLGLLGKIFAAPVRIAKLGITGINPAFSAANVVRDQLTAFVNSKNAINTSLNPKVFVKSLFEAVGHKKLYEEMARQGALGTSFDIARNQLPKTVDRIRSGSSAISKIKYTVTHPSELLRAVENVVGRTEELTRIQQYAGTKEALMKSGMSEANASIEAAKAARENTANFSRRGEWGKALNSVWLYLNAGIQGSRSLVRGFARKPAQTAVKVITSVYTPVALTTLWNTSDPERREAYNDISEYEKENNLILIPPNPTKDDKGKWNVIKISLPPGLSNISTPIRMAVERAHDVDSTSFADVAANLVGSVSPIDPRKPLASATPQIVKPALQYQSNYDFFTGSPTVPESLKGVSPELQYNDHTSGTVIKLAQYLGASPLKVQKFIKDTFGGASQNVLNEIDTALGQQQNGEGILESIESRFAKASGGEIERQNYKKMNEAERELADKKLLLKKKVQPIYDEVMNIAESNPDKAQQLVKNLSDEEYDIYKSIYQSDKQKKVKDKRINFYPTYKEVVNLINNGNMEEAENIVKGFTDEEYKDYEYLYKKYGGK